MGAFLKSGLHGCIFKIRPPWVHFKPHSWGFSTSGLLLQGSSGATKGTGLMCPPALFFATAFAAIAAAIVPKFFLLICFHFLSFTYFWPPPWLRLQWPLRLNVYQLIDPRFHFSSPTGLNVYQTNDPKFHFLWFTNSVLSLDSFLTVAQ